MFQLTREEAAALRSQSATSKTGRGGRRSAPYAFTEQGVAMLSSVLHSERAIAVNIKIMRAFVEIRRIAVSHEELARRLDDLEHAIGSRLGKRGREVGRADRGSDCDDLRWPPCRGCVLRA